MFGENLVKGTGFGSELANDNGSSVIRPWWYTRLGNDPANPNSGGSSGFSVLDFSLFSTFRDNVTRDLRTSSAASSATTRSTGTRPSS